MLLTVARAALFLASLAMVAWLHVYVWRRLARDTKLPRRWRRGAAIAIGALAACMPATMLLNRLGFGAAAGALAWPTFLWLGTFLYLALGFGLADLARRLTRRRRDPDEVDEARRTLVARAVAGGVAAAAGGVATVGILRARGGPDVVEVPVELARLPRALDGFSILQLSDLHVGLTVDRGYVEDLVRQASRVGADLIAFTGDVADGTPDELAAVVAPLAQLRARYGQFYVTGNHDYYSGVEPWLAALDRLGYRALRNERVAVGDGADSFDLAGIDDHEAERFGDGHGSDLARALDGRDPSRELVLLAHQPRHIEDAAAAQVGLQLSGHTHGGQLFPWHLAAWLQQRGELAGWSRRAGTQLYVSRGCGYWGPPMRVGAPPELARLVLRAI